MQQLCALTGHDKAGPPCQVRRMCEAQLATAATEQLRLENCKQLSHAPQNTTRAHISNTERQT